MAENAGNSNIITRKYLDSLLIQTRYMNADYPDPSFELYGKEFPSPIMTAALSHLDHFMFEGAAKEFAQGAADSGLLTWYGMADEEEIDSVALDLAHRFNSSSKRVISSTGISFIKR